MSNQRFWVKKLLKGWFHEFFWAKAVIYSNQYFRAPEMAKKGIFYILQNCFHVKSDWQKNADFSILSDEDVPEAEIVASKLLKQ